MITYMCQKYQLIPKLSVNIAHGPKYFYYIYTNNKTMKTFFTFFLLCIAQVNCTAQWLEINSGFNNAKFNKVFALTPDHVLVIGNDGLIIKSTNGGGSWQQKNSGTSQNLIQLNFPSPLIGYAAGNQNQILKTTDGGETWVAKTIDNINAIATMSCVNDNLIFLSTDKGLIKSVDGGTSWSSPLPVPDNGHMQFASNNTGFIGSSFYEYSGGGYMAKTNDGGATWETLEGRRGPFHFLNENLGFYYSEGLHRTTNGANQFDKVSLQGSPYRYLSDIFAINDNTVWGILNDYILDFDTSSRGIIKLTKSETGDYTGQITIDNDPGINMTSIHFANENCGYIVGRAYERSKIWKNGNGMNFLSSKDNEKNYSIKVFPNPASDKINVSVADQLSKDYTITLTDMSGKLVYQQQHTNAKEVTINIRGLAKGAYILAISSQQQNYSQKIIVN